MVIYKITNEVNGKSYVGQTTQDLSARWKQHLACDGHCIALTSAMKKYGTENFIIEEIYWAFSTEELLKKEKEFINNFNTLAPNGYNLTSGGEAPVFSEITRQKMSRKKEKHSRWGKNHTEESKKKMSESAKKRPPFSKETREKISKANTGTNHWTCTKEISEKTRERLLIASKNNLHITGPLLQKANESRKIKIKCNENNTVYASIREAARSLKISSGNLTQHLKGNIKHVKGFTFTHCKESHEQF